MTSAPLVRAPLRPSRSPWRNVPAYLQIVKGRLRTAVAYRQNVFFVLAVVVVQIYVLQKVWKAVYAGSPQADQASLQPLLVYLTIASLQNWALQDPSVSSYIHSRVREGQVAFDLVRPAGFIPQMLAHLTGSSLAMAGFALIALPVVALVGTLSAPASADAFGWWALSLLCGYVVAIELNLIIGLVAFWTMEINGVTMLYYLVNQFFAGALVPLGLFPGLLRTIADWLPFQATTYTPVAIYVGQLSGDRILPAIVVQMLWVAVLAVVARLLWFAARRRVVVQGG